MAVQETRTLPAQFIEDLGKDLAKQVTAQSGVPVVSTGLAGISQQAGETAEDFAARQQAAREFTTRQQSLAGLAPQVAGQDALQQRAQSIAEARAGFSLTFQQFLPLCISCFVMMHPGIGKPSNKQLFWSPNNYLHHQGY